MLKRQDVAARLTQEATYLRADVAKARAAVTPARRSLGAITVGGLVVVWSVLQWLPVLAGVLVGVFLIVSGLLLVDLDATPVRRRRSR